MTAAVQPRAGRSRARPTALLVSVLGFSLVLMTLGLGVAAASAGAALKTHYRVVCEQGTGSKFGCHNAMDYESGAAKPSGWTPPDLLAAYGLAPAAAKAASASAAARPRQRIAVVVAYDYPSAAKDLAVYRSAFKLPPCTTQNGCFAQLDQTGGKTYPGRGPGSWTISGATGLQLGSAICPACSLELVEAKSNSFANLETAVATAARTAQVIVAQFGTTEFRGVTTHAKAWTLGPHPVVVSTGDAAGATGYSVPPQFPASSPRVIAVGGTVLTRVRTGYRETVNQFSVSGCSRYFAKPSFQKDPKCPRRAVADTAAVSGGVAVYDSSLLHGGWGQALGTGVAASIVGGVYGRAGNAASIANAASIYAHPSALHDITSGSNGTCGFYLCAARRGYDGPTGMGTPKGVAAF